MLPPGNDVPPPANHALEEQAEGHHHHPPHQTDQGNHGNVAEGPVSYSHIGDILRGQLTDRPRAPTNPRSGFLRLYDRDDTPLNNRFDYYSDYLGDDTGTDKSADPDYFYYEVQHQRSRNRNKKPYRDRSQSGALGSDLAQSEDNRYRGDNIHGMDGAHAFFGYPDVKATEDSDYPAGQSQWGWRDPLQRTNPYADEQGLRVGAGGGLPDRAYGGTEPGGRQPPAPNTHYNTDSRLSQQAASQTGGGGGAPSGRLRNQLGRGRLGSGGGRGAWANSSPTKPPLQVQTKPPTLNPALVTPAPILANKEVSSLSSSASK